MPGSRRRPQDYPGRKRPGVDAVGVRTNAVEYAKFATPTKDEIGSVPRLLSLLFGEPVTWRIEISEHLDVGRATAQSPNGAQIRVMRPIVFL